jgi:Protein of unknown function (DUF3999)
MKSFLLALSTLIFAAFGYEAGIPYFSRTRTVTLPSPDKQNYVAIDADVWKYARPDLSDLRLYDGQSQVPYVVRQQSGGSMTHESQAKVLNLGTVAGHTEFDLDTSSFDEYDRVRLQLDAKNFINSAQIEGRHTLNDRPGAKLGISTLYDFTKEGLGANFVLKFPSASLPYLHVRLAPGIRPDQVKGAYLSSFSETKAAWTNAGQCTPLAGQPKQTVYQCSISEGVPVERMSFTVPAATVNFNRTVVLSDEHGNEFQRSSISRVRMNRAGQAVTSEDLALDIYPHTAQQIKITIENGDDPPLPVQQVQPLSAERRLYFDPKGKASLQLYYGDAKLETPSYDYAKFFQQSADAAVAQLGAADANPQFTGRPDDRPWSERHSIVLWAAMLLAVVVLGGLALRGLKGNTAAPR